MSTLGIVALSAGYGLPALAVACRVASLLAWHWRSVLNSSRYYTRDHVAQPSGEQWFGGMLLGVLAAIVWPLVLAVYLGRSVLLAPPAGVVRERQQARIAELERELKIGGER